MKGFILPLLFIIRVCAKSLQSCSTLVTSWTIAHQASQSMGFFTTESPEKSIIFNILQHLCSFSYLYTQFIYWLVNKFLGESFENKLQT